MCSNDDEIADFPSFRKERSSRVAHLLQQGHQTDLSHRPNLLALICFVLTRHKLSATATGTNSSDTKAFIAGTLNPTAAGRSSSDTKAFIAGTLNPYSDVADAKYTDTHRFRFIAGIIWPRCA